MTFRWQQVNRNGNEAFFAITETLQEVNHIST